MQHIRYVLWRVMYLQLILTHCFTVSCVSYYSQSTIPGSATSKIFSHRSTSSASLASNWNPGACKHRTHHRLEKLKALKLDNNKIRKFVVCAENPDDQNLTSSDESERFPNDSKAVSYENQQWIFYQVVRMHFPKFTVKLILQFNVELVPYYRWLGDQCSSSAKG